MQALCPRGCDPRFLQYVTWRGSDLRIVKEKYNNGKGRTYDLVLRCADCCEELIVVDLPVEAKKKLDHITEVAVDQMRGLAEQYDQEYLERRAAFNRYLEETNRG
jgi:hypothetical protein